MRSGRHNGVLTRRVVRVAAVVMFFVLGSVTAMGSADAAALPQATLKFSSVRAFVKSLFADSVGVPRQLWGSSAYQGGSAAATRAGKGTGHAPGKGVGELSAYSPLGRRAAPGLSGRAHVGFDAKTSVRNARKSDAYSTWFDNTDGSHTVKTSTQPVNYKVADGSWQPVNGVLVRGTDGRLRPTASGLAASFAGASRTSGASVDLARPGAPRSTATVSSDLTAGSTGELAQVSLGTNESFGWSLSGAAPVDPSVAASTATYAGILPDTTLQLADGTDVVKETLTLSSAAAGNTWTFPLQLTGVSLRDDAQAGWQVVDSTGAVVGALPRPFAYDSTPLGPTSQQRTETQNVTYALTTDASGAQSLVMTLDASWLDDPARVFPVTVDPTLTAGAAGYTQSTYVQSPYTNDYSSDGTLKAGYSDWQSPTYLARSFVYLPQSLGFPVASGYHVTQANIGIFDIWAATCTAEPIDAYEISGSWSITGNKSYPGPALVPNSTSPTSIGESTPSVPNACGNVNGYQSVGDWVMIPLDTNVVNQWTSINPTSYYGFAIDAPNRSSDLQWKIFDSTSYGSNAPYVYFTYTPNSAPQVNSTSPTSGYNAPTLTPVLRADASDSDNWPGQGLAYQFEIFDLATNTMLASSNASCGPGSLAYTSSSWTVPTGVLKWGQTYYWAVRVCDEYAWSSWSASAALVPAVPPPLLTSSLSQNPSGHGFDPALGNYTTSATDAQVATIGPALSIVRDYNSLDPRTSQALGSGWSSMLDARAAEQYDTTGAVVSVTVTYPDGSQVGYGRNAGGSFVSPLGRFATLQSVTGGYSLTDKNHTVYRFTQSLGSGAYGLTSIADASGRTLALNWTSGQITTLTSASGRHLTLTWTVPTGAKYAHVKTIATDAVTSGGTTAPLTWTYAYQGDQLYTVCDPTQAPSCAAVTTYAYESGSQYRTAQLDGGPLAYWPLSETSGTTAGDLVLGNEHSKDATYASGVTLGAAGNLTGSTATSASFNGSTGHASTSGKVLDTTNSFTVSAWVNLNATPGFEDAVAQDGSQNTGFELQYDASDNAWAFSRTTSDTANAVAIKAHASSAPALHTPTFLVGVYDAAAGTLRLYVNGAQVATAAYTASVATTGSLTIGRGKWNGTPADFFNGSISDVAVYQSALPTAIIGQLYTAGTTSDGLLTSIKRPTTNQAAKIQYATDTGRVQQVTDADNGIWIVGSPTVSGSAEGYRSAVMGSAPSGYWRLGDAVGSTVAYDEVAADSAALTYYNTPTLGVSGPLNSSQSAATFNGTNQDAATAAGVLDTTKSFSVSAWANLPSIPSGFEDVVVQDAAQATGFELQYDASSSSWAFSRATSDTTNAGSVKAHASSKPSTATWYHLVGVYDASGKSMKLYVNGQLAGSGTAVTPIAAPAALAIGRGRYNGTSAALFNGSIAEVAVYPGVLDGATVAAMYAAGKNAAGLNPTETVAVTDPGNKTLSYEYDPVNQHRLIAQIDGNGAKTTYGYDTSGFLHAVVDANGNETITGHDPRGNPVSRSTCQYQAANACSTSYFTYYPDDTSSQLTTDDPRNDVLLTASDGRSSSASDATYREIFGYDGHGPRISQVSPPVPGYPGGRIVSTVYTDGTNKYLASDDANKVLPPGLPWQQVAASGTYSQYHYYANGDLYSITTPTSGLTTGFVYDQLGRPVTKTDTYNTTAGCTSSCATNALVTSTTYDGLNRAAVVIAPTTMDRITGAVHQARTTTVYDVDGNQVSQTVADVGSTSPDAARTVLNHYNSLDQLDWTMDAQQYVDGNGATSPNLHDATQYQYDLYGNKSKVTSAQDQNGRSNVTDYTYDADGRLQTTKLEGYTGSPSGSQPAADLTEETRTYDPAGRLASVTDAMTFTTLYQYYDDNLTASVTRCDAVNSSGACTGSSFVQESDSYDGAGNLVKSVTNNGTTETDYTYDAANRQTQTTLDPSGLKRTTTKTYNVDDELVSQRTGDPNGSGTTDYQYNADGAMTSRSVEDYTTGTPVGWWKLDDGTSGTTPSTVRDWSGNGHGATLSTSGVSWASGAASFSGASGEQIATGGPVVDTSGSFSVSAWANLSSTTGFQDVVSQDATNDSGFELQYDTTDSSWAFSRAGTDTTGPTVIKAHGGAKPATGSWHLLVGTFDASTGAMALYVDGSLAGTATDTTPYPANGPLAIGRGQFNGAASAPLSGQVSNVQIYPRLLSQGDVTTLDGNGRAGAALSASANTTGWALDGRDLPLSMTEPDGQITSYVYDEAGRRTVTMEPAVKSGVYTPTGGYNPVTGRPTTTTGYDTFGDALETTDPTSVETKTTYDADGRATATGLPDYRQPGTTYNSLLTGEHTMTQYNELGQQIATWDPPANQATAAVETTYGYDQLGHVTTMTLDPTGLNRTTTTARDPDGEVSQTTDPTGAIQTAAYDYLGRTLSTTQVLGIGGSGSGEIPAGCQEYNNVASEAACFTTDSYTDRAGFLSQTTSPSGVATTYGYNAAGERTSITDAASQTTTTGYDYAGRAIKTTYPDGTYATAAYDQAGLRTGSAQYDTSGTLLSSSSATYDGDGNLRSSTDANGNQTQYGYDDAGRLTSETQPASYTSTLQQVASVTQSITTSFGYDAAGRQTEYVTGNSNAWYTTYNAWGLPESSIAPATTAYSASTATTTYDAVGNTVEQDAPGGVVTTGTYDNAGALLSQSGSSTITTVDALTSTRTFTYYPNGLLKSAATSNTATSGSNATSEAYGYDDSGALASTSGTAGSSAFTYNADGQMHTRTDASGTTTYGHSNGRLASINEPLTGQTLNYAYTPNLLDYTITYGTGGDVRTFHYNSAHELASDTLKTTSNNAVASIAYGYDPNGNETSKTTTAFTGSATNTYTYDQANRLKSWTSGSTVAGYAYDQDGNRTSVAGNTFSYDARDELQSDGSNSYAYTARGTLQSTTNASNVVTTTASDAYNQQTTTGAATYTYDALGRVTAVGTAAMAYSGMDNQIASDTAGSLYSRDLFGALVGVKVSSTTNPTLAYTDQHSDLVGRFQPTNGALTASVAYDPLGNVLSTAGNQVALGYQSEYTNRSSGTVNMAARWYNPATGQFNSKDTVANSPVPDSANANGFAYGNDNPLTATDPTGHRAFYDDGNNRYAEDAAAVRDTFHQQYLEYTNPAYIAHINELAAQSPASKPNVVSDAKTITTTNTVTCSNYMAMQVGCTAGQPIRPGNTSTDDGTGFAAFLANIATTIGAYAGCDALGGGPEDPVADIGCLFIAGSAGGASSQGVECASHGASQCSAQAFASSMILNGTLSAAGGLTVAAACRIMCTEADGLIPGLFKSGDDTPKPATPDTTGKSEVDGPALPPSAADATSSLDSATDIHGAKEAGRQTSSPTGKAPGRSSITQPDQTTPTETNTDSGTGATNVDTQPATPVTRSINASKVDPAAPEATTADTHPDAPSCVTPHSFAGSTPVLMADGTAKPIDQIHIGDKITNAAPNGATETHTVDDVIVTTTDRDFVALTVTALPKPAAAKPAQTPPPNSLNSPAPANGLNSTLRAKLAAATAAAALVLAPPTPATHAQTNAPTATVASTLATTYHHQFYDATTNQWTQAENLRPGDLLQTPTGYAVLDATQLYHATATTYDLTINGLHTYYVVAGNTPVLVHNCDGIDPHTGGLNDATYDRIDEAHGPKVAQGVDYQVQRMHDGSATALDHVIPGIGHNPDALGDYFAGWEGNMTHMDLKTGAQVAYDESTGSIIVENSYMVHGYQLSRDVFDSATFTDESGITRQRYVLQ